MQDAILRRQEQLERRYLAHCRRHWISLPRAAGWIIATACISGAVILLTGCNGGAPIDRNAPPSYNQGAKDGCASGYSAAGSPHHWVTRDWTRWQNGDSLYQQGWHDGYSACMAKYNAPSLWPQTITRRPM